MKRARKITLEQVQKELAAAGAPFDVVVEAGLWFEGLPTIDFDPREVQREIIEGAARGFYVSAVMGEAEELGYRFASGTNIEDQIRPTPPRIFREIKPWVDRITKKGRPLWVYYLFAVIAPGKHEREPTPHDYGYSLAFESVGHGVAWTDHHPQPALELDPPSFEIYNLTRGDFKGLEKVKR